MTNQNGLGEAPIGLNVDRAHLWREGPEYYTRPLMFTPCHDWVCDADGTLMVDYVASSKPSATGHIQRHLGIRRKPAQKVWAEPNTQRRPDFTR